MVKQSWRQLIQISGSIGLGITLVFSASVSQTTTIEIKKSKRKTREEAARSTGVSSLRDGWNPILAERKLKPHDQALLVPNADEVQKYATFLTQPGTGLFKLLNMDRVTITADQLGAQPLYKRYRGGGSYYSFIKQRHDVDDWAQLKQQKSAFHAGTAQVDWAVSSEEGVSFKRTKVFGKSLALFILLNDFTLESVTPTHESVRVLKSLVMPTKRNDFADKIKLSAAGFKADAYSIVSSVPIKLHSTYLLRSVIFNQADMLIAFRVVREDADGSVHILWKKLA